MELGLSLGGGGETTTPTTSTKPFPYFGKTTKNMNNNGLRFCMSLGGHHNSNGSSSSSTTESDQEERRSASSSDHHHPPLQLALLPFSPAVSGHPHHQQQPSSQLRLPWLRTNNLTPELGSIHKLGKGLDVNRLPTAAAVEEEEEEGEEGTALSSPNSTIVSSFQMDFSMYRSNGRNSSSNNNHKRDHIEMISDHNNNINEVDEIGERGCSRGSDDEENGLTRKKLRLSKDQSAFLEESFKEHNTLNPKQKLALARELNLRPRQVEVWFQNRRARTKLKQTEVDCEYLKRCCETLTEENRRLQKELQELKVLKTSQPFYMQLPATTLTMCPSCERVATTTTTSTTTSPAATTSGKTTSSSSNAALALAKSRLYPFITHAQQAQAQAHQAAS